MLGAASYMGSGGGTPHGVFDSHVIDRQHPHVAHEPGAREPQGLMKSGPGPHFRASQRLDLITAGPAKATYALS